jgi:cytochrome oxidase Cu insertion factor (SCO1/SenC/PrrC family)
MISKIHFQSDKIRKVFALLVLSLLIVGLWGVKTAQAETVSQTFNSPTQLTEGSLVSLQQGSQNQIELANTG